jgi:hypothetical protein
MFKIKNAITWILMSKYFYVDYVSRTKCSIEAIIFNSIKKIGIVIGRNQTKYHTKLIYRMKIVSETRIRSRAVTYVKYVCAGI